jgi:hypothetical protein
MDDPPFGLASARPGGSAGAAAAGDPLDFSAQVFLRPKPLKSLSYASFCI